MMDEERFARIAQLFIHLVDVPAEEWNPRLNAECQEDSPELRDEVLRLLQADAKARQIGAGRTAIWLNDLVFRQVDDTDSGQREQLSDTRRDEKGAPSDQRSDLPIHIGKYQVVQALPGGGQAAPLVVHDPDVDRHVVLKRYTARDGRRKTTFGWKHARLAGSAARMWRIAWRWKPSRGKSTL